MNSKIFSVKSFDDYPLEVKVDFPDKVKSIVVFCHGSGPNTYDNHRNINGKEFNYFDLFAEEFGKREIAFCRWNTRGCKPSDEPPNYVKINMEEYKTYIPSTSVEDIIAVANYISDLPKFKKAKLIFMGISEGSSLIPIAAQKSPNVAALLLLSFSYYNLKDVLEWQLNGNSSMVNMRRWFDYASKGFVDKKDFEADHYQIRPIHFPNVKFEDLDLDGDGKLTQHDFSLLLSEYRKAVFSAIENNDDEWLMKNYSVPITSKWLKDHFALPPISSVLSSITIPIYIFQGMNDANIPSDSVQKLKEDFSRQHKENLTVYTFANHDHDLNYLHYPLNGVISEGLQTVFNIAAAI